MQIAKFRKVCYTGAKWELKQARLNEKAYFMEVSGFIVLSAGPKDYPHNPVKQQATQSEALRGMSYRGLERPEWEAAIEDYYSKTLPENILPHYLKLDLEREDQPADQPVLGYTRDLTIALHLYAYCQARKPPNDFVVFSSPWLDSAHDPIDFSSEVEWLGYDIVTGWSLIENGPLLRPELFDDALPSLNRWGLLDSPDEAATLVARFKEVSGTGILETLLEDDIIDVPRVGIVPNPRK